MFWYAELVAQVLEYQLASIISQNLKCVTNSVLSSYTCLHVMLGATITSARGVYQFSLLDC